MKLMNVFVISLTLISIQQTEAQTCAPVSKEMAQYQTQRQWRVQSVPGEGVAPVAGYVDEKNNFYISDLSRGGAVDSTLTVDPANRGFKAFFKYCSSGRTDYLRSMRRNGENNRYRLSMRYLPPLTGFANNPLAEQKFKDVENVLRLKFAPDSSLDTNEWSPQKLKSELADQLNKQLPGQEWGRVDLDLTGWDDVVCDLVRGKMQLTLNRNSTSDGPIIEAKRDVEPQELSVAYRRLREAVPANAGKERTIFMAARTLTLLDFERRIGEWADKRGFEALQRMMNADMSRLNDLDETGLNCVADQMQSYKRPVVQHFINVKFKIPTLEAIEQASQEKKP